MRITKEVIIAANKDEIWPWLTEQEKLGVIIGAIVDLKMKKNGQVEFDGGECWKMINSEPPEKLSFRTGILGMHLTTTLELTSRGRRTNLRVNISGWENIAMEKARVEMPKVSLNWEKRLSRIKKVIESSQKRLSANSKSKG